MRRIVCVCVCVCVHVRVYMRVYVSGRVSFATMTGRTFVLVVAVAPSCVCWLLIFIVMLR